jgi:hypothetical protein
MASMNCFLTKEDNDDRFPIPEHKHKKKLKFTGEIEDRNEDSKSIYEVQTDTSASPLQLGMSLVLATLRSIFRTVFGCCLFSPL